MDWTEAQAARRAQLEDAQRDVRLWLAVADSNEERAYLRGIEQRLAVLERTVDHRIYRIASDDEEGHWEENVRAFLELFDKAKKVRGCAVGENLSRLADLFNERSDNQSKADRRAMVDTYIAEVLEKTGKKIKRKDIWTVAGYRNATEFERFQRHDQRTTSSAVDNFRRVLSMNPREFIQALKAREKTR